MYLGCASVLQSIVTSVPAGAPTSWFGTHIIGETTYEKKKKKKIEMVYKFRMNPRGSKYCFFFRGMCVLN